MIKTLALLTFCALAAPAVAQQSAVQAEQHYQQGLAAQKRNDPATAQKLYTSALQLNPNHNNARYSLGQLKIIGGSLEAKAREEKFGNVVIPVFQMDQVSLTEALEALKISVEKNSSSEQVPNFVVEDSKGLLATQKITLNLKNTPMKGVLRYILEQVGAKMRHDEHAVVIMPR